MAHLSDEVTAIMARLGITRYSSEIDDEARRTEERMARQDHDEKRAAQLRRMNAPDYLVAQLRSRRETQATMAVRDIVPGILVLGGKVNVGKSVGALSWLWHAPGPICYLQASALNEIAPWGKKPWQGKRSILLDDAGTEDLRAVARVEELVVYAHGRRSATLVITTNLDKKDFKSRYGERVTRRIRERQATGASWVTITGLQLEDNGL